MVNIFFESKMWLNQIFLSETYFIHFNKKSNTKYFNKRAI